MADTKAPPKIGNQSARQHPYLVSGLVCLGVAGMIGLLIWLFGGVSGTEFSPTHFQVRRFTVQEIPWLKMQISPIRRTSSQLSAAQYLVAQKLIQQPQGPPNQWHLVELLRGGMQQSPADAKLLIDQLELITVPNQGNNAYWHDWSMNEPAKAQVLWPVIQKLAIRELYILLPKIFAHALAAKDDSALRLWIDDYLRTSYGELVTEMRNTDRAELADELLSEAILDFPDDAKLQALR